MDLLGREFNKTGRTWEDEEEDDEAETEHSVVAPVVTWLSPDAPEHVAAWRPSTLLVAVGPVATAAVAELTSLAAPTATSVAATTPAGSSNNSSNGGGSVRVQRLGQLVSPQAAAAAAGADLFLLVAGLPSLSAAAATAPAAADEGSATLLVCVPRPPPIEAANAWSSAVLSILPAAADCRVVVLDTMPAWRLGASSAAASAGPAAAAVRRLVYPPHPTDGFSCDLPPSTLITGVSAGIFQKRFLRRLPVTCELCAAETAYYNGAAPLFPALLPLLRALPPRRGGGRVATAAAGPPAHLYT